MKENNKLIAEFINWKSKNDVYCDPITNTRYLDINLQFDSNWSWLMPIVEKICKIELPNDKYHSGTRVFAGNIYPRTFGMLDEKNNEFMFRFNGFSLFKSKILIETVYKAVIEVIKWYNKNKLNK